MVAKVRGRTAKVRELSLNEGWELLEREARRYLGMSAKDFIRAWQAGAFGDLDDNPDALSVAMLLPFVGLEPWSAEPNP